MHRPAQLTAKKYLAAFKRWKACMGCTALSTGTLPTVFIRDTVGSKRRHAMPWPGYIQQWVYPHHWHHQLLKATLEGLLAKPITKIACLLSFVGFLRVNELIHIRPCKYLFMMIKLHCSRTDQLRKGDEVIIARSGKVTCPVTKVQEYMQKNWNVIAQFQVSVLCDMSF